MRILPLVVGFLAGASSCFPTVPRSAVALPADLNREPLVPGVVYATPLRGITHMRLAASADSESTWLRDEVSSNYHSMRPVRSGVVGHSAASAASRAARHFPGVSYQNITALGRHSTQYGIECEWDGKPIWLLFDTGSSDTWAVRSDFFCEDRYGGNYSQASCQHGPNYADEFSHGELPGLHLYLSFGSGERVSGPMGLSDLTVGGITVDKVEVGLVNRTYWRGNGVTNGILGLAYGGLTSAYYGAETEHRETFRMPYAPFVSAMMAQSKLNNRSFSVAIERNSSAGVLAWGGLPPVEMINGRVASVDLIITNINAVRTNSAWKYSYYTILVDGMQWGKTEDTNKYLYIVDTATTLMYLPPPLAEAIAAAFEPRAAFLWQHNAYFVHCEAAPPVLAVKIGGRDLLINPADLIYQDSRDPATGYCQIGIASGGDGPYILGDVFLQSVVAVFDIGRAQMRFYPRA